MGLIASELTSCRTSGRKRETRLAKKSTAAHDMSASSRAKIATMADILSAHKNKITAFVLDIYTTLTHSLHSGATGLFHNKKVLSSTHHVAFSFNNSRH